ncbi:LCP family protein [Kitasatospora nipponensis]|uniref:LCP family protein n=1 Tax=Kitasatospora nipponensis TaxID=258049 RepID=A0ABN1VY99_9ACTN
MDEPPDAPPLSEPPSHSPLADFFRDEPDHGPDREPDHGPDAGSDAATTGDASADAPAAGADPPDTRRGRRRRARRVLLWALAALLGLTAVGVGGLYWTVDHYMSSVRRIPDAFPTLPASAQPAPVPGSGTTFLLVGLDARSDVPTTGQQASTPPSGAPASGAPVSGAPVSGAPANGPAWQVGAARSDTMMLLHISADRKSAAVVSIARDTWVNIPGHGMAKINAAYSWGGPALMIQTVQDLTHIHVDHFGVIDWNGFKSLTDAVGGVDITIPQTIEAKGESRGWQAGSYHMDGDEALLYVRERHGLPDGDLDRTKRQQNFLRALLKQTLNSGTLTSPTRLAGLLRSVGDVVSVDSRLSNSDLYDLAWSLRDIRPDGVHYLNAPFAGFDTIDGQDVVQLDTGAAVPLWDAIRNDTMTQYLQNHRVDSLGDSDSVR